MSVEMLSFCERQLRHKRLITRLCQSAPSAVVKFVFLKFVYYKLENKFENKLKWDRIERRFVHGILLGSHHARVRVESLGLEISGVRWEFTRFHPKFKLLRG